MDTKMVAGRNVPVDPKLATDDEVMHVIRPMQERCRLDRPCPNCGGTGVCQPDSIGYRFGMRRTCPACGGDGQRHAG